MWTLSSKALQWTASERENCFFSLHVNFFLYCFVGRWWLSGSDSPRNPPVKPSLQEVCAVYCNNKVEYPWFLYETFTCDTCYTLCEHIGEKKRICENIIGMLNNLWAIVAPLLWYLSRGVWPWCLDVWAVAWIQQAFACPWLLFVAVLQQLNYVSCGSDRLTIQLPNW